jgi:hypothetical protein
VEDFALLDSLMSKENFDFSKDERDVKPSAQFEHDLKDAQNPFLMMFVGNGRTGKSTRVNQ